MKRIVHASLLLCAVALLAGSCKKDSNSPTPSANVPIVTTVAVSSIAITTAISGGIVLSDSGSSVTARGVCWSTSPNPTVAGSKTTDGTGLGSFTSNLTGLTANTTYYIRAYATNAKGTGYGNEVSFATHPTISIATVNIPGGTFSMGSPITEYQRDTDEVQHQVSLTAFKMSKYEITNAEFALFLNAKSIGSNGIYAAGAYPTQALIFASSGNHDFGLHYTNAQWVPSTGCDNRPVVGVTWYGATEFAAFAGGSLPTEAQWEYACHAGTSTPFNTGDCLSNTQANYDWSHPYNTCTNSITTSPASTLAVGTYAPNALGLYDMHGNVWEWCSDWYGTYSTAPQTNPVGPASGTYRVLHGGSLINDAQYCRAAFRDNFIPSFHDYYIGFRMVFPQ